MFENYYNILELKNGASDEEIKKAYKKMAIKYHPDKQSNKSEEEKKACEDQFKKISEAYEVLTNKEKYINKNNVFQAQNFMNPNDLFEQLFKDMNINMDHNFMKINVPNSNNITRSSTIRIVNGQRIETIRENINGVISEKTIITPLNNSSSNVQIRVSRR
jgi:DnaJ-class molecular chaperone